MDFIGRLIERLSSTGVDVERDADPEDLRSTARDLTNLAVALEGGPLSLSTDCSRCGLAYNRRRPAGSRTAVERDVAICPTCGLLEAVRDEYGWPPVPPVDWPLSPDDLGREYALMVRDDRTRTRETLRLDELKGGES